MKAPVTRVVVFRLAIGAEGESGHGGGVTVVGCAGDDAVAGAAVGAGNKGVVIAAIGGVKKFTQTVGAEGGVGSYLDIRLTTGAGEDGEFRFTGQWNFVATDGIDTSQGRGF